MLTKKISAALHQAHGHSCSTPLKGFILISLYLYASKGLQSPMEVAWKGLQVQ